MEGEAVIPSTRVHRVPRPTSKIWGVTDALIVTPMFEMHRLTVKARHRCSLHVHRFKHNAFYVLDGAIFIDVFANDYSAPESYKLTPGEFLTVPPGVHHQFRTDAEGCYLLEMYYTEPLSEDIVRRNVGGLVEN